MYCGAQYGIYQTFVVRLGIYKEEETGVWDVVSSNYVDDLKREEERNRSSEGVKNVFNILVGRCGFR